jgi:hypothetical protein
MVKLVSLWMKHLQNHPLIQPVGQQHLVPLLGVMQLVVSKQNLQVLQLWVTHLQSHPWFLLVSKQNLKHLLLQTSHQNLLLLSHYLVCKCMAFMPPKMMGVVSLFSFMSCHSCR